jgi:hypothetical protein
VLTHASTARSLVALAPALPPGRHAVEASLRSGRILSCPGCLHASHELVGNVTFSEAIPAGHKHPAGAAGDTILATIHAGLLADPVVQLVAHLGDAVVRPLPHAVVRPDPRAASRAPADGSGPDEPWRVHLPVPHGLPAGVYNLSLRLDRSHPREISSHGLLHTTGAVQPAIRVVPTVCGRAVCVLTYELIRAYTSSPRVTLNLT